MIGAEKDWVFVSDAHFTGPGSEGMKSFLRFLDSRKGMGDLVILGDLFEFLFGFKNVHDQEDFPSTQKSFFPFPEYLPVFERLKRLSQQGIRIRYFEGNHDFFLQSFFKDWFKMEVEVHPDGCEERLGGRRSFLAHGDLSNPMQWKYRFFRMIVKNRWMFRLIQLAGPYWSRRVALKMSGRSHQRYHAAAPQRLSAAFHSFVHQKFQEGFEVVILAHSHFPEKIEEWIEGRRCLYFNVGDWMIHRSYLTFTPPDHFELSQFNEG